MLALGMFCAARRLFSDAFLTSSSVWMVGAWLRRSSAGQAAGKKGE